MTFIEHWSKYNEANEIPDIYVLWSGLFLLNATAQRRVYVSISESAMSYDTIKPNLYIGLIGSPASGKSYCRALAQRLFCAANSSALLGSSRQSFEAITTTIAQPSSVRAYKDEHGNTQDYCPMTFFVNEMKNWFGVNPIGMVDFLTDIYDQEFYDASTIKHGLQMVARPCLNVLLCETPEWFQNNVKLNLVSGGFARRIIYIYHPFSRNHKAFQTIQPHHQQAWDNAKAHLQQVQKLVGPLVWTPDARAIYKQWYENPPTPPASLMMKQFHSSRSVQVLKLCIALALNEPDPKLELTATILQTAIEVLEAVEPQMSELADSIGRNELLGPMKRLIDFIKNAGGYVAEKEARRVLQGDFQAHEFETVVQHLKTTEQLHVLPTLMPSGMTKLMLVLPDKLKMFQQAKT